MPHGRFISYSLGDSERFAKLTSDLHRTAYMLLVTWSDEQGRFLADSVSLRGKLYTRLPWGANEVEDALLDMHRVQLVRLYEVDGKRYGVIEQWHDHQKIRRDDNGKPVREGVSRLPEPPRERGSNCGSTAAVTAAELPLQVEVEVQVEVQDKPPPTPPREPPPPPDDGDADRSITLANKRRANRHTTSLLTQQHPETKHALDDLQSIYSWKPAQYAIFADRLLEFAREHGDTRTSTAINHMLGTGATITNPLAYLRKLLTSDGAGDRTPTPRTEMDLDALFGPERPMN